MDIKLNHQNNNRLVIGYSGLDKLLSDIGYDKNKLMSDRARSGIFSIEPDHNSSSYVFDQKSHRVHLEYFSYSIRFTFDIRLYIVEKSTISEHRSIYRTDYPNDVKIYNVKNMNTLLYTYRFDDAELLFINNDLDACIDVLDSNKIIRDTGLGLNMDYKELLKHFHESIQEIKSSSLFYWGDTETYSYTLRWVILSNESVLEKINSKTNTIMKTIVPGWSFSVYIVTSAP